MKVRVHTLGWVGDIARAAGEEASASIHSVLELDGHVYPDVTRIAVVSGSEDFTKVIVTLIPGELETVVHDGDSWKALLQDARDPDGAERRQPYRAWLRRRK